MTRQLQLRSVCLALCLLSLSLPALAAEEGVVNVNTAEQEQLMLLPRVGPAIAARILEFREANGRFKSSEELMLVRGIGEKTFALLEPYVVVEGETTLTEKIRVSRIAAESEDQ